MIPFSKYSGAGNDFVIVDAADLRNETPRDLARRICPRRTGVGVDGLALVGGRTSGAAPGEAVPKAREANAAAPIRIRFFNPDGSEFATCGNGTRCVARHAAEGGDGSELRLVTAAGEIGARVEGERVTLDYRLEVEVLGEVEVPFGDGPGGEEADGEGAAGQARRGWLVRNDTPHLVLPVRSLPDDERRFVELCRPIRHHPSLGPDGANVNLVHLRSRKAGAIRTYERGIEDETLACGAGCISSTVALHAAGACDSELRLRTRSGHELVVELDPAEPLEPTTRGEGGAPDATDGEPAPGAMEPGSSKLRRIRLSGPAVRIFEGRFPEL